MDLFRLKSLQCYTEIREFTRTSCKQIILLLLQVECSTHPETRLPSCRTNILKPSNIFQAQPMERYTHRSAATSVLTKWEGTKINSKRNCIFRSPSAASNAGEATVGSKATRSVLPTEKLLLFSICIGDLC